MSASDDDDDDDDDGGNDPEPSFGVEVEARVFEFQTLRSDMTQLSNFRAVFQGDLDVCA
jgi:hypothetical protein